MIQLSLLGLLAGCTGRGTNVDDVITSSGEMPKEERIIFQDNGGSICSIRPEGNDKRVIEEPIKKGFAYFSVSPDGKWMFVLQFRADERRTLERARVYDLRNASFRRVAIPAEGDWEWPQCWWSDDSNEFHMYSAPVHIGVPFPFSFGPTAKKKRMAEQTLTYRVDTGNGIIRNYTKERMTLWDYIIKRGAIAHTKCDFVSPDGNFTLKWDVPEKVETYGEACGSIFSGDDSTGISRSGFYDICLLSNKDAEKRPVFKNGNSHDPKFDDEVDQITQNPWSPDSRNFVLEKHFGGFFRALLFGWQNKLCGIYVIDRGTLEWDFLAYGDTPHWLAKVPLSFTEQPSPPAKITFWDN